MDSSMKQEKEKELRRDMAIELTDKIIEAVLFHVNGYSRKEIKDNELTLDCHGSDMFDEILEHIEKSNLPNP